MARRPTSILSYSHDSSEHDERVLSLAERLRHDGIDCEIDAYQVSPPEGWPGWMRRQLQERDFCIVVCTETYARRFAGDEAAGTGKGATWEGRLLRQILYEEGKNDRVIPVVFSPEDVTHIPLELKDATRYDLSSEDGYEGLHRALTAQPLVERGPLGPVRRHLPLLVPEERAAAALLGVCPDALPLEVIARGAGTSDVRATLSRLVAKDFVSVDGGCAVLLDRAVEGIPTFSGGVAASALEAILDFVAHHYRDALGKSQLMNAVTLARATDMNVASAQVSRAFRVLHPLLKAHGDKRLVLDVARRSIEASKSATRGPEQAKDEAVAVICGVSWVYQRTGRLTQARAEAEHSLELGIAIRWDRNTAFCRKCLGRLKRMEAESGSDRRQRGDLLVESEELLRDAIERFTQLGIEAEVGDCYSLLARTYLVADRPREAREAMQEAKTRLVEPGTKDYLDLLIVTGDLMAHTNRRSAENIYTEVLADVGDHDAQKSEIFARAHLHRGQVRAALGDDDKAFADFRRAAEIWDALGDPAADLAHWEIERRADWMDKEAQQILDIEPVGVRVKVARMVRDRSAGRRVAAAKRAKLPEKYLHDLVREARERLAVERPEW